MHFLLHIALIGRGWNNQPRVKNIMLVNCFLPKQPKSQLVAANLASWLCNFKGKGVRVYFYYLKKKQIWARMASV